MPGIIYAATGHRPNKLGGYGDDVLTRLVDLSMAYLNHSRPDKCIAGGAIGWDTGFAIGAIKLGIPLTLSLPFRGQEKRWIESSRKRYDKIISKAFEVIYVDELPEYFVTTEGKTDFQIICAKMQKRNENMADNATRIIALHDGTSGGTGNCVRYCNQRGIVVTNLWKSWIKYSGV
jgi:hypothetical protein